MLLLAVLLVPLLRFIDLDAANQPADAPFAVDGLSKDDPTGIVTDRKERTRFVTRIRATPTSNDDDDDAQELDRSALRRLAPLATFTVAGVRDAHAPRDAPRGRVHARGPPA